ncbi:hypothetical protein EDB89DRAFT_1902271 [Lactarius sanguifluus]|nr:hypothetical protein EDB89DRAFT_1902271 [Lactarius sanguifluus]
MYIVGGVLHDVAGSWRVLGRGGGELAGGGVLRAVSGWRGGRSQLGLACHVEGAWRVGGVLACVGSGWRMEVVRVHEWAAISRVLCCVGAARWVGGGGVAGQDGGGSHEWAAISRVLRRVGVARWVGSGGVSEQDGGGSRAQMAVLRAVLGRRVGGGSMLQAMSGRRVGAGTNGSGSRAQGDGNGLQR